MGEAAKVAIMSEYANNPIEIANVCLARDAFRPIRKPRIAIHTYETAVADPMIS
jgi:hypothetical protein